MAGYERFCSEYSLGPISLEDFGARRFFGTFD